MTDYIFEITDPTALKEYESWIDVDEIVSKADDLLNQGFLVAVLLREANVLGRDYDGLFYDRQYHLEGVLSTTPETLAAMIEHGVDGLPAYRWRT